MSRRRGRLLRSGLRPAPRRPPRRAGTPCGVRASGGGLAMAVLAKAQLPTIRIMPAGTARMINWAAAGLLVVVTLVALLAPLLAPHDPLQPIGMPQQAPGSGGFLLGSD